MFNAIVLSWFLTLGWVPNQYEFLGPSSLEINAGDLASTANMGFSVSFDDRLTIHTDIKSYQFSIPKSLYFAPYRVDYTIGGGL